MSNRRTVANVKLTRKHHFQYMGWWIGLSVTNVVLLALSVYVLCTQIRVSLTVPGTTEGALFASELTGVVVAITALCALSIVALGILTAHRIAGPYVALVRTCQAITEGDTSRRLHFRESDRLENVEAAFNEMLAALYQGQQKEDATEQSQPRLKVVGE